jgi:hypothetical protein
MTTRKMIVKILWMACRLLEEKGWNRGAMARNRSGEPCGIESQAVDSFCLSGALVNSWRTLDRTNENLYFTLLEARFSDVIFRKYGHSCTLSRWNDRFAKHREEVIELIHAVIKSIEADSPESFAAMAKASRSARFATPVDAPELVSRRDECRPTTHELTMPFGLITIIRTEPRRPLRPDSMPLHESRRVGDYSSRAGNVMKAQCGGASGSCLDFIPPHFANVGLQSAYLC